MLSTCALKIYTTLTISWGKKKLCWASFWACKFSTLLVDVQTGSFILAGFPQSQPCEEAALTVSAFSCFKRKILVMHFCQKPHSSHIQLSLFLANELNPCLGFHTLNSDRYWENLGWRIKEHWCYLVQPRDCPMSFVENCYTTLCFTTISEYSPLSPGIFRTQCGGSLHHSH